MFALRESSEKVYFLSDGMAMHSCLLHWTRWIMDPKTVAPTL